MAGRTMRLSHKGTTIVVCEGMDGEVEFRTGNHHAKPEAKSFEAATNEARKWLLEYAGEMKGNYER
jgi:hypothetical protein